MGVDIPGKKRIEIALRYIYGIGPFRAMEIIKKAGIQTGLRADKLSDENIAKITSILQNDYLVEGDLRRTVAQDIRRLVAIGSYRGLRHRRGLPVRGQRTKTNARTRKGKRKTVGAIRDKTERKTAATGPSGSAPQKSASAAPAKSPAATPASAPKAPAPKK